MKIKFLFLRVLLVRNTKKILKWFDSSGKKTEEEFFNRWQTSIQNPKEVQEILRTLSKYGLIRGKNKKYNITQEGRDFLVYLGWK